MNPALHFRVLITIKMTAFGSSHLSSQAVHVCTGCTPQTTMPCRYCCMEEAAQQAAAAMTDTRDPLQGQTSESSISRVGSSCPKTARDALRAFCQTSEIS